MVPCTRVGENPPRTPGGRWREAGGEGDSGEGMDGLLEGGFISSVKMEVSSPAKREGEGESLV